MNRKMYPMIVTPYNTIIEMSRAAYLRTKFVFRHELITDQRPLKHSPFSGLSLFVFRHPVFSPRVREVHDQYQLDNDENESSRYSEIHPYWSKASVWNEERCHSSSTHNHILDTPESKVKGKKKFIYVRYRNLGKTKLKLYPF